MAEQREKGQFFFVLARTHKPKPPRKGISKTLNPRNNAVDPDTPIYTATYKCKHWKDPKTFVSYKKYTQRFLYGADVRCEEDRVSSPSPNGAVSVSTVASVNTSAVSDGLPATVADPQVGGEKAFGVQGPPSEAAVQSEGEGCSTVRDLSSQQSSQGGLSLARGGGLPTFQPLSCPFRERASSLMRAPRSVIEERMFALQAQLQKIRRRLQYRSVKSKAKRERRLPASLVSVEELEEEARSIQEKILKLCEQRDGGVQRVAGSVHVSHQLVPAGRAEETSEASNHRAVEAKEGERGRAQVDVGSKTLTLAETGAKNERKQCDSANLRRLRVQKGQDIRLARTVRERCERSERVACEGAEQDGASSPASSSQSSNSSRSKEDDEGTLRLAREMHGSLSEPLFIQDAYVRRRLERLSQMRVVPHCGCPAEVKVKYLLGGETVVVFSGPDHSDVCWRNRGLCYKTPKEALDYIKRHCYLPMQALKLCFQSPEAALQLAREVAPSVHCVITERVIENCLYNARKQLKEEREQRLKPDRPRAAAGCAVARSSAPGTASASAAISFAIPEGVQGWGAAEARCYARADADTSEEEGRVLPSRKVSSQEAATRGDDTHTALHMLMPESTVISGMATPDDSLDASNSWKGGAWRLPCRRRGGGLLVRELRRRSPRLRDLMLQQPQVSRTSGNQAVGGKAQANPGEQAPTAASRRPLRGRARGKRGRGKGGSRGRGSSKGTRTEPAELNDVKDKETASETVATQQRDGCREKETEDAGPREVMAVEEITTTGKANSERPPKDTAWVDLAAYFLRQARRSEEEDVPFMGLNAWPSQRVEGHDSSREPGGPEEPVAEKLSRGSPERSTDCAEGVSLKGSEGGYAAGVAEAPAPGHVLPCEQRTVPPCDAGEELLMGISRKRLRYLSAGEAVGPPEAPRVVSAEAST
ncbi:hypothetical protein cyc_00046 [Cyclospora cayetanensis]|uniref:Uncharacterized protein n=1 Tax=Cyclospora cayetanensis TaxID=88456 RepID=A0A1D3CVH0_9EIME|nr:hypothetical protein cyc_00046 [Cyclospora cayetanensis]